MSLLVLASACGEEAAEPEADVQPGFEAAVEGAVRYAMAGRAYYVVDERGRLVGLELSRAEADTSGGLSFELAPLPPGDTTYAVAADVRPDAAPGDGRPAMRVFLDDADRRFTAEGGTLRLKRTSGGLLQGTFDLRMRGYLDEQAGDDGAEVAVTGTLVAGREGAP